MTYTIVDRFKLGGIPDRATYDVDNRADAIATLHRLLQEGSDTGWYPAITGLPPDELEHVERNDLGANWVDQAGGIWVCTVKLELEP